MAVTHELDDRTLDLIVQRVVEAAKPRQIVMFGSAARGELGPNSDIDLLVVKEGPFHRGKLTEKIYMNMRGVGHAVDIVAVTTEDVERYRDSIGTVIRQALREGKVVYDA